VPELRFDPLGRRDVILAPERARRGAPAIEGFEPDPAPCDFCGGQEARTPPETFAIRRTDTGPDTPGWSVRVVPNLYPATAFHEVVVHTPDHQKSFEDHAPGQRLDVMRAYRARIQDASTISNVVVWNRGRASGASRTHAHGQLFGVEHVPPTLEREAAAFTEGPCVLCGIIDDEKLQIGEVDGYRVLAHPVPFVANELLIVPPCTPTLETLDDDDLAKSGEVFALAISRALRELGAALPFNLVVHTAPRGIDRFHWHAHLMPRTAVWGGLEMGAELAIVAADPYETARAFTPAER
jgi:UDPglucose--hexose-1-phosphate uridylyltransferase